MRDLGHRVLGGGWLTDEGRAARELYEWSSRFAREEGARVQSDAEIAAEYERSLASFVRDFLARQPGVAQVPTVAIVRAHSRRAT